MSGRRFVAAFLVLVAVFAAALVYFQYFAFYERVDGLPAVTVAGESVPVEAYRGIDATSSPLKLRGCFRTEPGAFADAARALAPEPLTPPPWFGCFDARAIAQDIEAGRATAHLVGRDEPAGFDRVVAAYPDGRAYLWRQLGPDFAH